MQNHGKYLKFIVYLVVIVLVNMVGSTLFFRIDLTRDGIYSLSPESRKVVSTLTEPLTIKAFFTKNLPAPHNATEQYLRDLLDEYAVQGNTHFNYTIYNVSPQDTDIAGKGSKERELTESYGIMPVQIQDIEKDEVKFKQAYMGLVILHGDMVEKIPTITSPDQLEYELTTAILKLNNKISALNGLKDKVKVTMFMSPSLGPVGPLMGIRDLDKFPASIDGIVKKIAARSYNKIEFSQINPTEGNSLEEIATKNDLTIIKWPAIPEKHVASGEGAIGLIMEYHGKTKRLLVLHSVKIPLLGTSYKLEPLNAIEEAIDKGMESLIGINSDIGYLADHGTLATSPYSPTGGRSNDTIATFAAMVEKNYTLQEIALSKEPIPATLGTLVIARPIVKFSDYELFQIDQALMRGTNLIIYTDTFREETPKGNQYMMGNQGPQFVTIDTGLEKLLDHYGVRVNKSIVLDESCFKQQDQHGSGGETPLYFAPIIKNKNINKDVIFLNGIKGMITLLVSPLELNQEQLKKNSITAVKLLSSSENSWEMKDHITLNPMLIKPPRRPDEKGSLALAYLLEGEFDSYFNGKPLPELKKEENSPTASGQNGPDTPEQKTTPEVGTGTVHPPVAGISSSGTFIAKGKKSKIFLMATSSMLRDNVIGSEGESMNAAFVMNGIDAFNGREGIAAMRSKKQSFNPLVETPQPVKTFIKAFNIIGLPILTALFGLFVWGLRTRRKQEIRKMFIKAQER
jgi:ABC-2 type transport system permease protein